MSNHIFQQICYSVFHHRASPQRHGNSWTKLATRVANRLCVTSHKESLQSRNQRNARMKKGKRRPDRPSISALGLIRPFYV